MNCREQLERDLAAIEAFLQTAVPDGDPLYREVAEAMRYSLLAGGKRIRALFVLECCAALGGRREEALPLCHTAFSSLHFQPVEQVTWLPVFQERPWPEQLVPLEKKE